MNNLRARARAALQAVDPVTMLALALLAAALLFQVNVIDPAAERLRALHEMVTRAQSSATTVFNPPGMQAQPAEKLGVFYAHFRRELKLSDWLARFHDVAERAGVRIMQADYRTLEERDAPLTRTEVVLPLTGDYGKIRAFAEGVLTAIPIASLDHIAFRRAAPAQGEVEAELRFTLHRTATP